MKYKRSLLLRKTQIKSRNYLIKKNNIFKMAKGYWLRNGFIKDRKIMQTYLKKFDRLEVTFNGENDSP